MTSTHAVSAFMCACRAMRHPHVSKEHILPLGLHYQLSRHISQEEKHGHFQPDSGHIVRPGADNFFDGGPYSEDNPVAEQQMVATAREYYRAWSAQNVEAALTGAVTV